jgi:hypothetical protein
LICAVETNDCRQLNDCSQLFTRSYVAPADH